MIFSEFFKLNKIRFRIAFNSIFRANDKNFTKIIILLTVGSLFVIGDYLFFKRILAYFNNLPLNVGEILIIQLLNLLCLTLFSMLVFSNIIVSLSTLYLSRDLDLLMSSPIPVREVFLYKFALTTVNSSWMALIFGLPVFIAYGKVLYASWIYYILLPVLLVPFLLAASSLGVLVTMTLMRFFPARKTYQFLTFVGFVFIAGLVMYLRLMSPEKFLGQDVPDELIIEFVKNMKAPDATWLPSAMMAGALQVGAYSEWGSFLTKTKWLWSVALVLTAIVVTFAARIYYAGWSASYTSRNPSLPVKERMLYRIVRKATAWLSPQARALILKDVKIFWRDTGQWSQLFMLGALVVVYIFNIRNLPLDTIYLKNLISIMNIGLAGVVLAAVAVRFVFASTSLEGRCFWTIHSSPIDFRRFLWVKFFFYIIPLLILAEILVILSNLFLDVDSYVMVVSAGTIAAVTIGITGLGVGMGALYPKFDFENVAEVATTSGAMLYMIASLGYIGLSVTLISGPVYNHLRIALMGADINQTYSWIYFGVLGIVSAAMVYFPMDRGAAALQRMET